MNDPSSDKIIDIHVLETSQYVLQINTFYQRSVKIVGRGAFITTRYVFKRLFDAHYVLNAPRLICHFGLSGVLKISTGILHLTQNGLLDTACLKHGVHQVDV